MIESITVDTKMRGRHLSRLKLWAARKMIERVTVTITEIDPNGRKRVHEHSGNFGKNDPEKSVKRTMKRLDDMEAALTKALAPAP